MNRLLSAFCAGILFTFALLALVPDGLSVVKQRLGLMPATSDSESSPVVESKERTSAEDASNGEPRETIVPKNEESPTEDDSITEQADGEGTGTENTEDDESDRDASGESKEQNSQDPDDAKVGQGDDEVDVAPTDPLSLALLSKMQEEIEKRLKANEGPPDILGNMELDKDREPEKSFKDHFMRSVQGVVVVSNYTEQEFIVDINGVVHSVPQNATHSRALRIDVKYGHLRIKLYWKNGEMLIPVADENSEKWGSDAEKWQVVTEGSGRNAKKRLIYPLKIQGSR